MAGGVCATFVDTKILVYMMTLPRRYLQRPKLWMMPILWFHVLMILFSGSAISHGADRLDLSGEWRFELDESERGLDSAWFRRKLTGRIKLPGSLQEQGFGSAPSLQTRWTGDIVDRSFFTSPRYAPYRRTDNFSVPFWLQPQKHFVGPAWYQRDVMIPEGWVGKRILLRLERCHWQTTVWVDDQSIGSQNSLSTPHVYDLTVALSTEGNESQMHTLSICVDNRIREVNVGPNSHSVSDHTQSNWNGIIGDVELMATDPIWIDNVQVYPVVATKSAQVQVTLGNQTRHAGQGTLALKVHRIGMEPSGNVRRLEVPVVFESQESTVLNVECPLGDDTQLWDEFQPTLYQLELTLRVMTPESRLQDQASVEFGMREISTQGTQLLLNNCPISLRGTLECCIFPHTGYPPTDVESWRRVIQVCQAYGLNHMRFHSHCPPEAAFVAADQLGFYLQVECGSWANQGASVGNGEPLDEWLYAEADRILRCFGNHPSFLLMAYGNEPAGPDLGGRFLGPWVTKFRQRDSRRLYTSAAGWPLIDENQYHSSPTPRIHQWGGGLKDRLNAEPPATTADYREFVQQHAKPVVAHEIGQWCVYPNFDEIPKYTGVLRAKNFEIFRDFLAANHMTDQARAFLMASGKLQALCYKEEIESALRTPGFGGFQLLDLHDFPGQGTALVGVVDPFWDSKPYVSAEEFHRFCSSTVPLARLAKRLFVTGETLEAAIEVYHYGAVDLTDTNLTWTLKHVGGEIVDSGRLPISLSRGQLAVAGAISAHLPATAPHRLQLAVAIEGTDIENDWDIWVYPREESVAAPRDVLISNELDESALAALHRGEKVLLTPRPETVAGDVAIGFTPVFWNTAWTRNQPPHTLGILCNPEHAALASFPTEYHTNWQWWELVHHASPLLLNDLPPDLRPIVQVIDTWFEARRLGLIIEAKVGEGQLLVCSMDITHDLKSRPVARQMRQSLLRYMASRELRQKLA